MKWSQYVRLIARDARGSRRRLLLFVVCLAVGVAAIVAVGSLSTSMDQGIRAEARKLLGADVAVSARRPVPAALDDLITGAGVPVRGVIQRTSVRELVTVAAAPPRDGVPGRSRLVELKVIDGVFPFYGALETVPARALDELLTADTAVVADELLAPLGLQIDDDLLIGGRRFRIAGTVIDEPDRLNFSLSMGPRVFLSSEGLERASLIGRGSRVEYEVLLKLADGAGEADARTLQAYLRSSLPEAEYFRVSTYADAQPSLRRGLARTGQYLGLVGLLSLLIGGVGVAQTVRAWITERIDAIAVMRCLGMRPREALLLYTGQTALLGLVGSAVGVALGTAIHVLAPVVLFPDLIPPELLRPWQPLAILRGLVLGIGVSLLFSLPPLLAIRRIPPARVLRRNADVLPGGRGIQIAAWSVLAVGVGAAATWQAGSAAIGAIFTGGLAIVIALLAVAALGVSKLAQRLPRGRGRIWWRHGLSRLARPGAATVSSIVALGVGVMIVFAMHLVERQLSSQLTADLPDDAPSSFLVDIQPDQWEPVRRILDDHGAASIDVVPLIMARIRELDGVTVEQLMDERSPRRVEGDAAGDGSRADGRNRPSRWALRREQRLTYYAALPDGNEIIEGALWNDPARPEVSVEEDFARNLGVSLGSTITLNIQGVRLDLVVTSIRSVNWRTFGVNFFLVVEPGVLEDAPQMRIATAHLPPGNDQLVQDAMAVDYPNVTVIHIRDVLDQLLAMLQRLSRVVQLLGAFTVVAGVLILAGSISAGYARRRREVALLKTLGMTRREISFMFAVEYALVGLTAAIIGGFAGGVLAWSVMTRLMEMPWTHRPLTYGATVACTILLVVIAGLSASGRALTARPIEVLRTV